MRLNKFKLQFVQRVPEDLSFGTLYICLDCNVAIHQCACGCGEKVVLPIDPGYWSLRYDGENISLYPSVGNYQFACKSHYLIRDNYVIWLDTTSTHKNDFEKKDIEITTNICVGKQDSIFESIKNFICKRLK